MLKQLRWWIIQNIPNEQLSDKLLSRWYKYVSEYIPKITPEQQAVFLEKYYLSKPVYLAYQYDFDCSRLIGIFTDIEMAKEICLRSSQEHLARVYENLINFCDDQKYHRLYEYAMEDYSAWNHTLIWEVNQETIKAEACTSEYGSLSYFIETRGINEPYLLYSRY